MNRTYRRKAAASAILAACGAASAQPFTANFEAPTYSGSSSGVVLTGQQGWYVPTYAASGTDRHVYTYAGNTPGIVANPQGSGQTDIGVSVAGFFNRGEHSVDFSAGGVWEAVYDCAAIWTGTPGTATDALGSFSLQPSVVVAPSTMPSANFQTLLYWGTAAFIVNPPPGGPPLTNWGATTSDHFHMPIGHASDTAPGALAFDMASAAWVDLPTNHWFRIRIRWNFATRTLLEASIQDLTAGTPVHTDDLSTLGWTLLGGTTGANPIPNAIRIFTGAGVVGNVTAWDNIDVHPVVAPPTCYPDCNGDHALNVNDFICFQGAFAGNNLPLADCNHDTVLNVNDFICFQSAFAAGCSSL